MSPASSMRGVGDIGARGLDAEDARLRPGDAHRHRGGAASRRLRLHQGLPRRAAAARRQDHPDLGRHQPDPPPVDRPQFHRALDDRNNPHGRRLRAAARWARASPSSPRAPDFAPSSYDIERRRARRARAADRGFLREIRRARQAHRRRVATHPRRLTGDDDGSRRARRLRPRHRGHLRGSAGQATRCSRASTRSARRTTHLRVQHLDSVDHRDRRRLRAAPDRVRRHAFLPAGAADEAGRDVAGPYDLEATLRRRLALVRDAAASSRSRRRTSPASSSMRCWCRSTTMPSARSRPASRRPPISTARLSAAWAITMGPLELIDLIGLDTQIRLCEAFYGRDARSARRARRRCCAAWSRPASSAANPGAASIAYDGGAMFGGVTMRYADPSHGASRSFPARARAARRCGDGATATIALLIGAEAGAALARLAEPARYRAILVELGSECLAVTSATTRRAPTCSGFARFRLGDDRAVRSRRAGAPARHLGRRHRRRARDFSTAPSSQIALCSDLAGRIIDRLVRPYFNAALQTARRGAGDGRRSRPDGAARARLSRRAHRADGAQRPRASFRCIARRSSTPMATPAYAPARRARVAMERRRRGRNDHASRSTASPCSISRPAAGAAGDLAARRGGRRGDQDRAPRPRRRDARLCAQVGRDSVNFALLNRGKRSIALDLKSTRRLARARPLLRRADVLVEQFRARRDGAARAWATTRSREINPRLIYCSITGYGQTGPRAQDAGHDLNYLGDTGMLVLSAGAMARRIVPPALIADIGGGAYPAVINILLALQRRARRARAAGSTSSMSDNLFTFMYWAIGNGLAAGAWPRPAASWSPAARRATGSTAPPTNASWPRRRSRTSSGPISATRSRCRPLARRPRDPAATIAAVAAAIARADRRRMAAPLRRQGCVLRHRRHHRRGAARSAFRFARPLRLGRHQRRGPRHRHADADRARVSGAAGRPGRARPRRGQCDAR